MSARRTTEQIFGSVPTAATEDDRRVRPEGLTRDQVWAALAEIPDPEIPVISLVDLGVIKEVVVDGDVLHHAEIDDRDDRDLRIGDLS